MTDKWVAMLAAERDRYKQLHRKAAIRAVKQRRRAEYWRARALGVKRP